MAHFLFVDESGHDRRESPYEVLAGVAVEDRDLWNLIQALRSAELTHFGVRYTADRGELKAKKLLNTRRLGLPLNFLSSGRKSVQDSRGSVWKTGPRPAGCN